ncbi:MAG: AbrB/MazE/SpoVT family DNA-binding domain-containing protein [Thermaerobacter sp.]|jgi:AbrB family looped-hinge helix DNA binding protein|nr:AbrB/MazE/SpoVT family DNA-binding domain-containing protein [Thermaerobacter sp.]MDA8146583.1 AbrB/MazE/SpoVT family DNA-binding domain-containing protein [Thermaerobacter sp.]
MSVVTVKGQITLPKRVRDGLGLRRGDEVEFELRNGEAVIRKKLPAEALEKWYGYLARKGKVERTDAVMEELRGK